MKRKGFTLIELIAILVILAVLALISTPIVINVIESSQKEARVRSVISYADSVRLSYIEEDIDKTGKPLEELANAKMQGSIVECNVLEYDERYGSVLHGCSVKDNEQSTAKGDYCYINGNVYEDSASAECQSVLSIATTGTAEYNTPMISISSQVPNGTEYAQSKEISVQFPSLVVVEEYYFIKADKNIELSNVVSKCGTSTIPQICSPSSDKVLEANTWYQVDGNVSFEITSNIQVVAVIGSNNNFGNKASYKEEKIDITEPSITNSSIAVSGNKAVVTANCSDSESGISKYYFSVNDGKWIDNGTISAYTFGNLLQGETYTFKTKCQNGSGLTNEVSDTKTMLKLISPVISQDPSTASKEWAQYRTINISYQVSNENTLFYYFKSDAVGTIGSGIIKQECEYISGKMVNCTDVSTTELEANVWYRVNASSIDITYKNEANLVAFISDSYNYLGSQTYLVTNIDTTAPDVNIAVDTIMTDRVTVTATCSDNISGITKYEFTNDGWDTISTYTSTSTTQSHTFTGLIQNKEYTFAVRCTNGSGITGTDSDNDDTESIGKPEIAQSNQIPTDIKTYPTYAQQRVIKVTYKGENIVSPEYYFKSTASATVASGVVTNACGTGTEPGTCSTSSVTTLVANTWYKTNNATVDVTYINNGNLYAMTKDVADNSETAITYNIVNIDTTKPSTSIALSSIKTDRITVTATCSDNISGITKYEFSKDNGSTWVNNGTTKTYTFEGLTQNKEYTFAVRCTNGSALQNTASSDETTENITNPSMAYENTPSTAVNGYLTKQIIKVTYDNTNITSPQYFIKSTRTGVSSLSVTQSCGTGTTPGTCTTITSTTSLSANTWYKVSGNVNVTYSDYATTEGILYAITYDGTNYSGAATRTISKITKQVTYAVKHYQMNTDMTNYTLYETEILTGAANYTATPNVKTYAGFTSPSTQTVTIAADGSTVVEYRYARKQILVTFYRNTTTSDTTTATQTFTYGVTGQSFSSKGWSKTGYILVGWRKTNSGSASWTATSGVSDSWIDSNSPSIKIYAVWVKKPVIAQASQVPESTTYAQKRVMKVTYDGTNITSPAYYFKSDVTATVASGVVTAVCGNGSNPGTCSSSSVTTLQAGYWYQTTSTTPSITYTANGNLYAATKYKDTAYTVTSYTVSNIDTTDPETSIASIKTYTDRAIVTATCTDSDSGITSTLYSINGTNYQTSATFTKLTAGNTYTFYVKCTNGSGMSVTRSTKKTIPVVPGGIEITQLSQVPTDTKTYPTYAQQRVIRVTYKGTNIYSPEYYFKSTASATVSSGVVKGSCGTGTVAGTCTSSSVTTLVANTWYKTTTNPVDITFAKETATLYVMTKDEAGNASDTITQTLLLDTTAPSASIPSVTTYTNRAVVNGSCSDSGSGITSTLYSKNGTDYQTSNTFTGLTQGTKYTFYIKCTNGSAMTSTASKSATLPTITAPNIAITSSTIASGYTWATRRVLTITFSGANVQSPQYYFKSSVAATVASGVVTQACGTGSAPGTCTSSNVTTLTANTWYKTSSTSVAVTYTSNGTLTAYTSDGTQGKQASKAVTQTSGNKPSTPTIAGGNTSWTNSPQIIWITSVSSETSGILKYQYCESTSTSSCNGTWTDLYNNSSSVTASGLDVAYYHSNNADLGSAYLGKVSDLNNHYISYGKSEGRAGSNSSWLRTSQSISTTGTRYIYFRAIANNGQISNATAYQTTMIDVTAPSTPSITYNGGSNSCSWKNNYNLTLSSTDNVGISHYEIDTNSDGTADHTTSANFVPWDGYTNCVTRFRAVDHAGNKSGWTAEQHIHMDTTAPSVSVSVSGKVATFTMTDNVSLAGYGVSQSSTTAPAITATSWTTSTSASWTASAAGTYYVWVKDHAGNENITPFTISSSVFGYTWVSNYVSAGVQPLTIYGENLAAYPDYDFHVDGKDYSDEDDYNYSYYTNAVPTNGSKYINITIVNYTNWPAYAEQDMVYITDQNGNNIKSTGWHPNNLGWNETRTITMDVSGYSYVSIRGYINGYNGYGPSVHISTVTFSN